MFGPASLLLSRKCCLVCCFCMFLPEIRKARDNKREAGPDMSSYPLPHPTPIVAQIFGFFCFFWFSRWFCYAFGKGPLVFLVFLVFPMDLLSLCVRPWMIYTIGESGMTHISYCFPDCVHMLGLGAWRQHGDPLTTFKTLCIVLTVMVVSKSRGAGTPAHPYIYILYS